MSTREINLISEKPGFSQKEKYFKDLANRYLPVTLAFFIILSIVTFGYNFILDKEIAGLEKNKLLEKNKISQMEKNEGMYLMLKQKATAINTILSGHFPFDKIFEFVKSLEQQGGTLNNFTMLETGEMSFQMRVANTAKLDEIVNTTVAKAKDTFKRVEVNGITYKPDGSFEMTFLIDVQNQQNL